MNRLPTEALIDRREFVAELIGRCPEVLVVTGLGSPAYDVFAAGDRPHNFYLWGAMGGAASIGLGLVLAQPDRSVLVVTGDGEQLMGMGSLATIGAKQPANLALVVLDNGHYGETGMQRSHTSLGTSLVAVAKGCGIDDAIEIRELSEVSLVAERIVTREGVVFAQVFIKPDEPTRVLPPRDGAYVQTRFRAALGFGPL